MKKIQLFRAEIKGTTTLSIHHLNKKYYDEFNEAITDIEEEYNKVKSYLLKDCHCKIIHEYDFKRESPFQVYSHHYVWVDKKGLPTIHTIYVERYTIPIH